jgi:serine/threonine protein kinase
LPHDGAIDRAGSGPRPSGSDRERALIAGAILQAQPRSGSGSFFSQETIPADTFPGYEIIKEIHRGGQGIVYQAIQKATKRKVAVKVVKDGPFAGMAERLRFEREVQVLGSMQHPNIVTIHDSGHVRGYFFFVMDYISGQPLDHWIKAGPNGTRPIDEVLRVFRKICGAVAAAHLRGVVHRDLKPGNIRMDNSGEPHVLDFGLAKLAGDSGGAEAAMTKTGQFVGSLPWASPEQAEGAPEKVDIRTDVYSLGVILYQMLTGKFPYDVVGNIRDVLNNILQAAPARPSTVRRQINDEVETIVLKCLSKERERRYQSAGELERDVEHYLAGEPIEAKRDSGWYVISKTLHRYKWPVAAGATFVVTVTVLAAVMTVLYRQKSAAEGVAKANAAQLAIQLAETDRQRAFAESGLQATQTLAWSMLSDFGSRIDQLRGATPAKVLLRERALAAVAALKAQARDDDAYKRVLADALEQAADIHAGLSASGIGKTDEARTALNEAMELRSGLRARHAGEGWAHAEFAGVLMAQGRLALVDRRWEDSLNEFGKASESYEAALSRLGPDADMALAARDGRRRALMGRADAQWAMSEAAEKSGEFDTSERLAQGAAEGFASAAEYWNDRLRSLGTAGDHDAIARIAGTASDKHAAVLASWGQTLLTRAQSTFAKSRAPGATDAERARSSAVNDAGRALAKFEESGRVAKAAREGFERLAADQPANGVLAADVAMALHNEGAASFWAAKCVEIQQAPVGSGSNSFVGMSKPMESKSRLQDAAKSFARAVELQGTLASADESNLRDRRDLALYLNKLGNVQRELLQLKDAEETYRRSLELRRDLATSDQTPQARRDLAIGLIKLGQVREDLDEFTEALSAYIEAATVFDGLASSGHADAKAEADRVRVLIARAEKKLRESGGS